MQTDILSGHLDVAGFVVPNGRFRVKGITYQASGGGAGVIDIFDTQPPQFLQLMGVLAH